MVIIVIPLSQPLSISRLARKQGFCCVLGMFLRTRAALCWDCCHLTVLHYLLHYCHVSSCSSGPWQCYVRVLSCHWYIIVMFCHVPQDLGSVRVLSCDWYIIAMSLRVPQDPGSVMLECCHVTGISLSYLVMFPRTWAMWRLAARSLRPS